MPNATNPIPWVAKISLPFANTFTDLLVAILQVLPALESTVKDSTSLCFHCKYNSKAPLAITPLNLPECHSLGNAGNNSIIPS